MANAVLEGRQGADAQADEDTAEAAQAVTASGEEAEAPQAAPAQ